MSAGEWVRRRWVFVVAAVAVLAFLAWSAHGAVEAGRSRHRQLAEAAAQRARIEELGDAVVASQADIERSLAILQSATSPETQQRQAAVLADAIAQLQKSIDCVGLHVEGDSPPPCATADGRLADLRAGVDPFSRPTPTQGATP